jgi:hypothetical protein
VFHRVAGEAPSVYRDKLHGTGGAHADGHASLRCAA